MKFVIALGISVVLIFLVFEFQETRKEIREDLKNNSVSSKEAFEKINQVIDNNKAVTVRESKRTETTVDIKSHFILSLESASNLNADENDKLMEELEENPESTLQEISLLLSSNPHSSVWANSLNLIKNSKIDPDQKISFLKSQLQRSGALSEDEDHNIKVMNNYKRLAGALKDIYIAESRNPSELAEEVGNTIPAGELQEQVKSILYNNREDLKNNL